MKQTAVEWLFEQLDVVDSSISYEIFNQAKQVEKEQITDAHRHGFTEGTCFGSSPIGYKFTTSEQYYNETFKNEKQ